MTVYLFQLGTTPELSFAELQAVFDQQLDRVNTQVAKIDLPQVIQPQNLIDSLGGVVKIAQVWQELPPKTSEAAILIAIKDHFLATDSTKIHFALGELGRDQNESLDVIRLKRELEAAGVKVRFAATSRHGAGAALLGHRPKIQEVLVVQSTAPTPAIYLAQTVAVQNIDVWSQRDRGKPYADHKKGLLPPKLARLMVNLAGVKKPARLYDPFCGSGTILMEAVLAGHQVIGSDLDVKASLGTQENLDWLVQIQPFNSQPSVFTADATQVQLAQLGNQSVEVIVTEPFLGRQTPKDQDLANIFRGLEKLYWGAFRHWRSLLGNEGRVVIIFPRVKSEHGRLFSLDGLLDKLEAVGYTKRSQNLFYARPGAMVEREICVFDYKLKEK
jgi:tRNA G10  N-methylase Trm11